jgi:hypothetical protein
MNDMMSALGDRSDRHVALGMYSTYVHECAANNNNNKDDNPLTTPPLPHEHGHTARLPIGVDGQTKEDGCCAAVVADSGAASRLFVSRFLLNQDRTGNLQHGLASPSTRKWEAILLADETSIKKRAHEMPYTVVVCSSVAYRTLSLCICSTWSLSIA